MAERLRQDARFGDTVLIALTGWGAEGDRRRLQQACFDHHLTKPVDVDMLRPLLRRGRGTAAA